MGQPIPKKIKENNPQLGIKTYNTLLVDGSNLLELSCSGSKKLSSSGKEIGGVFQFLIQLKLLLQKGNFRYVYVFWDGDNSGQLRYNLNSEYKANRDKSYNDDSMSDYMKSVNERILYMQKKFFKPKKTKSNEFSVGDMIEDTTTGTVYEYLGEDSPGKALVRIWADNISKNIKKAIDFSNLSLLHTKKDIVLSQREILINCLEELFIRQCLCDETEADDFIAYYVAHKVPEENIVIFSNDRDLSQLIRKNPSNPAKDDVILAIKRPKEGIQFINTRNHTEIMGYDYQNVALKKIICGDTSDNIKGIKGVGEKTLFDNFPEFKTRKVTLTEVIDKAKMINEERVNNKKKPLKWAENIVNVVTDGVQGKKLYEINKKIIDLSDPLMPDDAKELLDSIMYAPLDPNDRDLSNLYKILLDNNIDDLKDESKFSTFFIEFKYLIEKEKKNI